MPQGPALRNLSPRPDILVDQREGRVVDPQTDTIGRPSLPNQFQSGVPPGGTLSSSPISLNLGRARVVSALPLQDGTVQVVAPMVVQATDLTYLADPDGNLVGVPGVRINRLLKARWSLDTRRLAG